MAKERSTTDDVRGRLSDGFDRFLDVGEVILRERPTMEHVLLLVFFITGVYMFWEAREFSPAAAEFPRVMAGATAILSFLILARNYLKTVAPLVLAGLGVYWLYDGVTEFLDTGGGLFFLTVGGALLVVGVAFREQVGETAQEFVAEPMQVLGEEDTSVPENLQEDEGEASEDDGDKQESAAMYVYDIDDPRGPAVTGVLCIIYMLLTFTIGMLYATPVFVAMWATWVRMDAVRTAALVVVSFVTAFLFYEFISGDIAEGWLTGWEPLPPDELFGLTVSGLEVVELGVTLL